MGPEGREGAPWEVDGLAAVPRYASSSLVAPAQADAGCVAASATSRAISRSLSRVGIAREVEGEDVRGFRPRGALAIADATPVARPAAAPASTTAAPPTAVPTAVEIPSACEALSFHAVSC